MAIANLSLRNGKRGKGLTHFRYIFRLDEYASRADKLEKVDAKGFGNMPFWAKNNPQEFWLMADMHERQNGRVYKEHIVALPRELSKEQRIALSKDWIKKNVGEVHPYSFAIHCPKAMDNDEQPHLHLMICERAFDGIERGPTKFFKRYNPKFPERGGAKKLSKAESKREISENAKKIRMNWQETCNQHLENAGLDIRIDMRHWRERGLDTRPQNISMKQFLVPRVKETYQAELLARRERERAEEELQQMLEAAQFQEELERMQRQEEEYERAITEKVNRAVADSKSRIGQSERRIDYNIGQIDLANSGISTINKRYELHKLRQSIVDKREQSINRTEQSVDATKQQVGKNELSIGSGKYKPSTAKPNITIARDSQGLTDSFIAKTDNFIERADEINEQNQHWVKQYEQWFEKRISERNGREQKIEDTNKFIENANYTIKEQRLERERLQQQQAKAEAEKARQVEIERKPYLARTLESVVKASVDVTITVSRVKYEYQMSLPKAFEVYQQVKQNKYDPMGVGQYHYQQSIDIEPSFMDNYLQKKISREFIKVLDYPATVEAEKFIDDYCNTQIIDSENYKHYYQYYYASDLEKLHSKNAELSLINNDYKRFKLTDLMYSDDNETTRKMRESFDRNTQANLNLIEFLKESAIQFSEKDVENINNSIVKQVELEQAKQQPQPQTQPKKPTGLENAFVTYSSPSSSDKDDSYRPGF